MAMAKEDPSDEHNSGQHCRLCLHWIDDALRAEQLVDIFSYDESLNSTLADKIRDCLGLCINLDDASSNICLNCVHTINFIDEFRVLCHQTEKLYESARIRSSDVSSWQCYNDHVSELRVLVRGQRDWADSVLDDAKLDVSVVGAELEDIFFPEFIGVKEEDNEDEQFDEYSQKESLLAMEIEVDPSEPSLETTVFSDDLEPATINDRYSRFQLKLKIAHELQAQMSDKPDFKKIGKINNMRIHEIKHLWEEMGKFYRISKERASAGHEASILRCHKCPLFAVLNILIPKFDGDKPYEPHNIINAKNKNRTKISIDLQVAIAEEMKAHPELWDSSLNCSAHSMEIIWKEMTQKLAMDLRTLRTYWRRLRGLYRMYKLRELKGIPKRDSANEKYDYLLSLLHEILANTMTIQLPTSITEETNIREKEIENIIEEENDDGQSHQKDQQLALAQEVQQYPVIWCYKHPDFHNKKMRDHTWEKIAEHFTTDCESVKQEWRQLKDTFRNRYLRLMKGQLHSDDAQVVEPLLEMFRENMQVGSEGERITDEKSIESEQDEEENPGKKFDYETKLEFAKACYDNDILWNTNHPDYYSLVKRNEVFDLIALQFGVSMEKIKQEWKSLRGMYRSRYLRYQNGEQNDDLLKTPLHQLMNFMFDEHMLVGLRRLGVFPKGFKRRVKTSETDTVENKPFHSLEDRMKLVEEISMYDILWNKQNPNHKKPALHEPLFAEIAAKLGHSPSIIKEEWKKLKRMHQYRQDRIARGRVGPDQDGLDPLHDQLDKILFRKPTATDDAAPMSGEEPYPKRRFYGKRSFSNDGGIKTNVYGTLQYVKVCELCGKQVERSRFEYHMNSHYGLTPYACSFEGCDKKYGNKVTRDRHEVIIHGEDGYVFQCDQCDMKFKQKAKYRYHYAVKHKSEEIPCKVCGKVFKHNNLLRKHMDIHASIYECQVCGKVLQKKFTLDVHMRVHTKEKPYPCELCEQRFMLKVQMKTHLLKVHGVVLEELQAAATTANKK